MQKEQLINEATEAMHGAYAPYSGFFVGAALLTKNGKVYRGMNIENAAYSATVCAERTALFSAIAQGERDFSAIAIVGGEGGTISDFCPPCGVCRQALSEFCSPETEIYLSNGKEIKVFTLGDLLPESFSL